MGCNGNCNQGRQCDCVPDVETEQLQAMQPLEALAFVAAFAFSALIAVAGVVAVGDYIVEWLR